MKPSLLIVPALLLTQLPVFAQQAPGTVVVQEARPVEPAPRSLDQPPPLDNSIVRRRLSIAPRAIVVSPPAADAAPLVKTTRTTTVVDTPGMPRRVYNSERSVVVVEDQNQTRELTYVTVPVLFVKDTAELFDDRSATALQQMAGTILEICAKDPQAIFDIEGHTSTEGTLERNMTLSAQRAQRVYDELTQRYSVPAAALSAHGYGPHYAAHPDGPEEQLQLDRRVLLVRTR